MDFASGKSHNQSSYIIYSTGIAKWFHLCLKFKGIHVQRDCGFLASYFSDLVKKLKANFFHHLDSQNLLLQGVHPLALLWLQQLMACLRLLYLRI